VIPISVALTATITLTVNLIPIGIFVAWNHLTPRLTWLALIPLLIELFVFTTGVGLILATLFVRFRDVSQLWELIGQLAFYASPIIIPVAFLPPWFQPISFLNPFVQIMQDTRAVVISGMPVVTATSVLHTVGGRVVPMTIALATLLFGLFLFNRQSPWFAERV
jgi:ABC-2 type transport system permease protein